MHFDIHRYIQQPLRGSELPPDLKNVGSEAPNTRLTNFHIEVSVWGLFTKAMLSTSIISNLCFVYQNLVAMEMRIQNQMLNVWRRQRIRQAQDIFPARDVEVEPGQPRHDRVTVDGDIIRLVQFYQSLKLQGIC